MSRCCLQELQEAGTAANGMVPAKPGLCPSCQKKGAAVPTLTVKNLFREHTQVDASAAYSFCRRPDCHVVYFSPAAIFRKDDLKVRVGIKETEDPVPLCYCFGYMREDIRSDLELRGKTDIPNRIKAEAQSGFCACEVKNLLGRCCLGDVIRTVREISSPRLVEVTADVQDR